MISVVQIYFNEETKSFLDSAFYPYSSHAKDECREHKVIREIYEMSDALKKGINYFGVTDWKFHHQTKITGEEILSRIKKDITSGTAKDVYLYPPFPHIPLSKKINKGQSLIHGELPEITMVDFLKQQGEQAYRAVYVLNHENILPADIFDHRWQYSMCNYWIATKEVFEDYCCNWLIPAMDFFKIRNIAITYPALEYLFGSFLAHSNYSFEYLVKKRYPGMKKIQWVKIENKIQNKTAIARAVSSSSESVPRTNPKQSPVRSFFCGIASLHWQ